MWNRVCQLPDRTQNRPFSNHQNVQQNFSLESQTLNQRIFTLVSYIKNIQILFHTRKHYFDILTRIPHVHINTYLQDALIALLSDINISLETRYNLLNDRTLHVDVVQKGHVFWFFSFNSRDCQKYKLLSAQYLLNPATRLNEFTPGIVLYLEQIVRDSSQSQQTKINCIDILKRAGFHQNEDFNETLIRLQRPINRIPVQTIIPTDTNRINGITVDLKTTPSGKRIIKRNLLYDDSQNVHTTSINESVKATIDKLFNLYKDSVKVYDVKVSKMKELSILITLLSKTSKYISNKNKIIESFDFILSNTSSFDPHGLCLLDVLILVREHMKTSSQKEDMEHRMIEELIDMHEMCVTGHLSRIVNVLSGFFDDVISISLKDQIKNYVYNHFNKVLSTHPDVDDIIDEMSNSSKISSENIISVKPKLYKMIQDYSIKSTLSVEFTTEEKMSIGEFNRYYDFAVNNYCEI